MVFLEVKKYICERTFQKKTFWKNLFRSQKKCVSKKVFQKSIRDDNCILKRVFQKYLFTF